MTAAILPLPGASTLPPAQLAKIAASAQRFEQMALGALLAPMFQTVDTAHGLFGGGDAEEQWKPMLVSEIAKHIATHGGLGLARPVMDQMIRLQENAK